MLVGALLDWGIQRLQHSPTPTTSVRTSWYRTEAEGKKRFNTDGLARSIEVFYKGQVFLLYSLQHISRKLSRVFDSFTIQFVDYVTNNESYKFYQVVASHLSESFRQTKGFCDICELRIKVLKTNKYITIFKHPRRKLPMDFITAHDGG